MLVTILGFGCNWWRRFGRDPDDQFRYTKHAAFYNSTGLQCGRKIRRHWVIPGLVRFNGGSNSVNPHSLNRCIGGTFSCTEPVFAMGGNRIVVERRAPTKGAPDYYLVVVPSDRFGLIDFQASAWKSERTRPIAASHLRERQETLVLMGIGDWLLTDLGRWYLNVTNRLEVGAVLQLAEPGDE